MKKLSLMLGAAMLMISLTGIPVYAYGDPGYEEEPKEEVLLENPEPEKEDDHTPISYDGTGTVIDDIENGSKHFYTIATDAGNVFYLIVDLDKESNNVYFLDTTKERDLLALAEKAEEEEGVSVIKEEPAPQVEAPAPEPEPEPAPEPELKKSNTSLWLILALTAVAGIGVFIYYGFIKPKKDADEAEEFEENSDFMEVTQREPSFVDDDEDN
jgi:hypothetical protein